MEDSDSSIEVVEPPPKASPIAIDLTQSPHEAEEDQSAAPLSPKINKRRASTRTQRVIDSDDSDAPTKKDALQILEKRGEDTYLVQWRRGGAEWLSVEQGERQVEAWRVVLKKFQAEERRRNTGSSAAKRPVMTRPEQEKGYQAYRGKQKALSDSSGEEELPEQSARLARSQKTPSSASRTVKTPRSRLVKDTAHSGDEGDSGLDLAGFIVDDVTPGQRKKAARKASRWSRKRVSAGYHLEGFIASEDEDEEEEEEEKPVRRKRKPQSRRYKAVQEEEFTSEAESSDDVPVKHRGKRRTAVSGAKPKAARRGRRRVDSDSSTDDCDGGESLPTTRMATRSRGHSDDSGSVAKKRGRRASAAGVNYTKLSGADGDSREKANGRRRRRARQSDSDGEWQEGGDDLEHDEEESESESKSKSEAAVMRGRCPGKRRQVVESDTGDEDEELARAVKKRRRNSRGSSQAEATRRKSARGKKGKAVRQLQLSSSSSEGEEGEDEEEEEPEGGDGAMMYMQINAQLDREEAEAAEEVEGIINMNLEEAFTIYVEYIAHAVEPGEGEKFMKGYAKAPGSKGYRRYHIASDKVEKYICSLRESTLGSMAHKADFLSDLKSYPYFECMNVGHDDLNGVGCQACGRGSHPATWCGNLKGPCYQARELWERRDWNKYLPEDWDDEEISETAKTKVAATYMLGATCHNKTQLYHRLFHYKLYLCVVVLDMLKEGMTPKQLAENEGFVESLFKEFQAMMKNLKRMGMSAAEQKHKSSGYEVEDRQSRLRRFLTGNGMADPEDSPLHPCNSSSEDSELSD
ncbi:unnamed protein product [Chrysoparadoxa australica]